MWRTVLVVAGEGGPGEGVDGCGRCGNPQAVPWPLTERPAHMRRDPHEWSGRCRWDDASRVDDATRSTSAAWVPGATMSRTSPAMATRWKWRWRSEVQGQIRSSGARRPSSGPRRPSSGTRSPATCELVHCVVDPDPDPDRNVSSVTPRIKHARRCEGRNESSFIAHADPPTPRGVRNAGRRRRRRGRR